MDRWCLFPTVRSDKQMFFNCDKCKVRYPRSHGDDDEDADDNDDDDDDDNDLMMVTIVAMVMSAKVVIAVEEAVVMIIMDFSQWCKLHGGNRFKWKAVIISNIRYLWKHDVR